ncbi:MAG: hypothetical protein U0U46_14480 [Saprospiraceae bacterium]
MQKLWLKDFEYNINPAVAQSAQQLVQAGAVRALREVEKHFWVALVEDPEEAPREVEVMITPHKIKAFTCECWPAGRRLMCMHIAATLLKLRQFLEQKAEERRARAEKLAAAEPGRLTVQQVLDEVSPEALMDFVRDYARRDRDFALALKTQFAAALEGSSNPFLLLLDAAIPRNLTAATGTREAEFRRLRKTLDDLETQLQNALTDHNFRSVFQISAAILEKVCPYLSRIREQKRDLLLHFCQDALQKLLALRPEDLSPELRIEKWELIFSLAERQIVPPEITRELVRFLSESAVADEQHFERIRQLFDRTPAPVPPLILQLFLAALAQRGLPAAAAKVLEDYRGQPALIKNCIVELYYLHCRTAATEAAEHFLAQEMFNTAERRELEDILMLIAEKSGDRERLSRLLRERFLKTGHFDFYNRLKLLAGDDWLGERNQLVSELKQRADAPKLATILAAEGELDALRELLSTSGELPFLQRYEDFFRADDAAFLRDRYTHILSEHLAGHFGRPAAAYAREALQHLLNKGETALVTDIVRALTAAFPERHTLPEELAELFPKNRRKNILQG